MAAGATSLFDHAFEQEMRALGTVAVDDRMKRIGPLARFNRVEILIENVLELVHAISSGLRVVFFDGIARLERHP